jgi:hypothetical protein
VVSALESDVAVRLLASTIPARLAFIGPSGHANVAPIWFLWRDSRLVMCTSADSAKVRAIRARPEIAVTIDSETPPYESVRLRGRAELEFADGVLPEYVECAHRYYGRETGERWIEMVRPFMQRMARISLTPDWVEAWDFRERFPGLFDPT